MPVPLPDASNPAAISALPLLKSSDESVPKTRPLDSMRVEPVFITMPEARPPPVNRTLTASTTTAKEGHIIGPLNHRRPPVFADTKEKPGNEIASSLEDPEATPSKITSPLLGLSMTGAALDTMPRLSLPVPVPVNWSNWLCDWVNCVSASISSPVQPGAVQVATPVKVVSVVVETELDVPRSQRPIEEEVVVTVPVTLAAFVESPLSVRSPEYKTPVETREGDVA